MNLRSLLPLDRKLLAVVVLCAACDGVDNIDVPVGARARIPARTLIDDVVGLVPFDGFGSIDFEQELRNQGVQEEDVDSVRVKTFTITIESPESQTFEFLDSIAFFVSAEGLAEARIASAAAIDPSVRTLELALDDVELEPYATAPRMTIRAEVEGERPEAETMIEAALTFDVDITVPGCN